MKKLFIVMFVFLSFVLVGNAATKISVSYKGLDSIHLQYEVEIGYKPNEIKIVCSDGEEASIDIGSLPEGGGKLEGTKLHSGLTEGNYTFQLVIDGVNYGSPVSVNINGKIGGTLLYNETINDVATMEGNVVVPDGKTLTIKNKIIGSASYNSIYVNGKITFQSGAVLNGVNIHFQGESVNIDSIGGNGELIFYQKSTYSTIRNCKSKFLITVQPNTLVSIDKSEIYGLQLLEESSLSIKDSTVLSEFSISKIKSFEAENTTFLSPISINGRSPKFKNCEFADFVTLHNRNEAEFKDCVFGSDLIFDDFSVYSLPKWSEDSSVHPTFSGNSFVGQSGPRFEGLNGPFTPVDLGVNYYGDKAPVIGNMLRTFLTRGTEINTLHFLVSNWNSSGSEMKNKKKLPSFWVNDYVVGHNCLPHPSPWSGRKDHTLLKGRETLLSLDVATNYTNVSGVKFKAYLDGDTKGIDPVNTNVILHRDISNLGKDIFYGNTTVDFIIPATDKDSVYIEVKIDTTGIEGFDDAPGKGEERIFRKTLTFSSPYSRQLNIVVQPVQLFIAGYTKSAPDGKGVENAMKKLIPAMLPISKEDINIWTAPVTTFHGGILSMLSSVALLNRIANTLAVAQGFINTTAAVGDWIAGEETPRIDFVVAVLPKGAMGEGITGASLKLRRGVIFVDETAPDAALHEMGHGIGLYTGEEQYDEFPPAGLQVEGLTAFINDESAANSINGFRNRFLHFPRKGQSWYEDKYWYDIMGSSATLIWPIESTFSEFEDYFQSTLGTKTKSASYKKAEVPADKRRIFVSGEIETPVGSGFYQFIPGTISVFDITEIATGKIDVSLEIAPYYNDDYKLECFNSSGESIYSQEFTTVSPYKGYRTSDWPKESTFCGTFDIPKSTQAIKIFQRTWSAPGEELLWETEPIFVLTSSSTPEISIIPPASGTLSDSVDIAWTTETTKQAGGTMQYVVMVSSDGGTTWIPTGLPTNSTSITIPTDFLPASNNITFKVVGSSGLGSNSAEVSNLTIENRKPEAIIVSPKDGWVGNTGTKWILQGYGSDIEDGTIPTGEWTIDGIKTETTEVVLSSGKHTLTFKVTDSGGKTDESSVVVEVKETIEEVDLSLNEECLTLLIPGRDPLNTAPVVWLEKDGVHRVILKIQNVGIETSFNASLYLKGPSDTEETLLTSKVFTPDAFEEVVLSETFIVAEEGEYEITGEITDITPTDTNISNNEWTWEYQTQPNKPVIEVLPKELNFGDVQGRKDGFILIKNYGNANLEINSLTITGSSEFSITSNVPDIPADNSILVPVYFSPTSIGEKEATLIITSNDKENPAITIKLKGNCLEITGITGDINGDNKIDISDVILCLRMAIKLPITIGSETYNPPYIGLIGKVDLNEDRKVDISDVILILRKAIGLD